MDVGGLGLDDRNRALLGLLRLLELRFLIVTEMGGPWSCFWWRLSSEPDPFTFFQEARSLRLYMIIYQVQLFAVGSRNFTHHESPILPNRDGCKGMKSSEEGSIDDRVRANGLFWCPLYPLSI